MIDSEHLNVSPVMDGMPSKRISYLHVFIH